MFIEWLKNHVKGSPVIVEGVTDLYMWGSRISVNTGLPTVIGWDWHQRQQRCGIVECDEVKNRINDVNLLYSSENITQAMEIIDQYHIDLIYIGELEKLYYSELGLSKFESLEKMGKLIKVYNKNPVTIYKVSKTEY